MQAIDFIKENFGRGKFSAYKTSQEIKRSPSYIGSIISHDATPRTDVFALILDAVGFDLIVRNRKTGEETIIDPPTE